MNSIQGIKPQFSGMFQITGDNRREGLAKAQAIVEDVIMLDQQGKMLEFTIDDTFDKEVIKELNLGAYEYYYYPHH